MCLKQTKLLYHESSHTILNLTISDTKEVTKIFFCQNTKIIILDDDSIIKPNHFEIIFVKKTESKRQLWPTSGLISFERKTDH